MAETFRKALVEVLVPEIRELREETRAGFAELRQEIAGLREETHESIAGLRGEVSALKGSVDELGRGQDRILARLDVLDMGQRMARLETLFEQHLKSSPPAA